jgi:hypothetical protein
VARLAAGLVGDQRDGDDRHEPGHQRPGPHRFAQQRQARAQKRDQREGSDAGEQLLLLALLGPLPVQADEQAQQQRNQQPLQRLGGLEHGRRA